MRQFDEEHVVVELQQSVADGCEWPDCPAVVPAGTPGEALMAASVFVFSDQLWEAAAAFVCKFRLSETFCLPEFGRI